MEIRDVLHGSIAIDSHELPIIDSRFFQRLRNIKQLGFAENSFPSATHNRYIHSLGAMHTASRAFETIFSGGGSGGGAGPGTGSAARRPLDRQAYVRFRAVVRLAALLHDIGHGPLSHTTEFAMPDVRELKVPGHNPKAKARKATHEDYTLKIILDSDLTPLLERAGRAHGFGPSHVAALIEPETEVDGDFFVAHLSGSEGGERGNEPIDCRPILKQLISSELDADRMDYLRRDSLHTGVSYGQFDFDWLLGSLTFHVKGGRGYLALQNRALYAFEDFLISRYHMFLMVYFHYKSVIYDELLKQYLQSPDCGYVLPADIDAYAGCVDAQLYAHLAKSKNEWARRISDRRPYLMLIELHSGIPATKTAALEQQRLLARVQRELGGQDIHYLVAQTTGELSKYFIRPTSPGGAQFHDPIFVRYDNHYSQPGFIPLEQCTDLFAKYGEKRSITRLYVSPENYPRCRHSGRGSPLKYEEDPVAPTTGLDS